MDQSMGTCKRDAFTARIDKAIESLNADVSGIVGNMRAINERLLPPIPTAEVDGAKSVEPQGWLEGTLTALGNVHIQVNGLRSTVNELFDAVEAGKIKRQEVK